MATTELRALRIAPEMDAGNYVAGANQKVAADKAMAASNREVAATATDTSTKISQAGDVLARLSRQYVDGYASAQRFNSALNTLSRGLDAGKIQMAEAMPILDGIYKKYGLIADSARFAAKGQAELAVAIQAANAKVLSQRQMMPGNDLVDNASGFRRQNLGFQLQDVGVSLYGGMPITTTLIQQGSQILGIYGGNGGVNALFKDLTGIFTSVARVGGPIIAVLAGIYGAYKLLSSYSAEAAVQVDEATKALAAQASPIGSIKGQIGELTSLQTEYQKAITSTATAQSAASASIIASTQREFDAKKQLLELELKRQEASIKVQQAELATSGIELHRAVGQQVFTRSDLERQGFADPRINGGLPFVRLPDDITGLKKTQEVLDNNPLSDKIKELQANLQLTELGAEQLRDALKQVFNDAGGIGGPTFAGGNIPIPQFRGVDDLPGDQEFMRGFSKSASQQLSGLKAQQQALGLTGAALEAFTFKQQALNAALQQNIDLGPDQIAIIDKQAKAYGEAAAALARAKLGIDLAFERDQLGRTAQDQQIAARLRGTGLGLDSPEAQQMRANQTYADARDAGSGFARTFGQELISSGGNIGKSFGQAFESALLESAQKAWGKLAEQFGIAFANWLTGGTGSGLTGGTATAAFGTASGFADMIFGKGAANDNYAPGASMASSIGAAGMGAYRSAIKAVESVGSGGYAALGPVLKGGDQALGAYQVMASNLPSWSQAAIGRTVSRGEFLGSPDIQDAVFDHQFGKYLSKYGNASDAASTWFTGGPLSRGANKMDVLGTTGSAYVDKFNSALGKASENVAGFGNGLGKLGSALSQFPAAPAGGGIGGGLGGLIGGGLSSIFSGSKAFNWLSANPGGFINFYADGTENAPPGWAWVGERGPELRKLRAGDVIRSNPASMQMAANSNGNVTHFAPVFQIDARGSTMSRAEFEQIARQQSRAAVADFNKQQQRGGFGNVQKRYSSNKG